MVRRIYILIALVSIFFCIIDAKYIDYGRILENPEFEKMLRLFSPEKMLTIGEDTREAFTLDSRCRSDLIDLSGGLARGEKWAHTMLDASSKPPSSGLLRGNLKDLGQQDECLAEPSDTLVRGHFCTYSFSASRGNVTLLVNPTLSICLPSTCTGDDIVEFFGVLTSLAIERLKDLEVKIIPATCSPVQQLVWDWEFIVCLIILVGFVAFLIACTIMDMKHKPLCDAYGKDSLVDTLSMFSLRRSAASILSMEVKKRTLPALDGIRCLSAALIVLVHVYSLSAMTAAVNILDHVEWIHSWRCWYIYVAGFAVNTFFALSGLLTTYIFLKKLSRGKKFNVPMYYLHRYLRLTPAVLALMIITIVVVPKLGSGGRWDAQLSAHITSCRTKWWPALLYLQNYVNKKSSCLSHLWYLAVDMHYFWISPLILYPLYKKPKFGLGLLAALLLLSLVIPASIIGIKKLPVMSNYYDHHINEKFAHKIFTDVYSNTYYRAGSWLIGVLFGYEVVMHDRQLNRGVAAVGWLTAIASFAFCMFGQAFIMDSDYEYNTVRDSFYWVAKEPIWAFGVCWIIYACIKNQAGFLSSILSSRIFLPFSRLSYCIYLVHFVLITIHNAGLKTPIYFSEYYLWHSFITMFVISTAVAFLFSILFEAPILVLEDLLRKKLKRKSEKRITQTN